MLRRQGALYGPSLLNAVQRTQVKKIVSNIVEHKHFERGIPNQSVSNVATITSMTNVTQGDTDSTRTGTQIVPVRIHFKGRIVYADSTQVLRILIFVWNNNDEFQVPDADNILGPGPTGPIDCWSFYNTEQSDSYRMLYDHTFVGSAGTSDSRNPEWFEVKRKLYGKMKFNDNTTNFGSKKVYCLMISDSSSITHPYVYWNNQLEFTDP